jgi:hypothetical protein
MRAVVPAVAAVVCFFYTAKDRPLSVIGGLGFMVVETCWTALESGSLSGGSTTWVQFWANVVYTPILLVVYRDLIPSMSLRILLFPLNVWLLEIIVGYALIGMFGRNTAWFYHTSDARCHGNIRLYYLPVWMLFGCLIEATWDIIVIPATAALEPYTFVALLLAVPLTFTTERAFGWPRLTIPK